MPPDVDELRRRLTKRGTETAEQIEARLAAAISEMESWAKYRYTIISRTTEEDLQKFRHIMNAERYLSRRLIQKRSEEHTSELQSRRDLVCRLLLEKKKY